MDAINIKSTEYILNNQKLKHTINIVATMIMSSFRVLSMCMQSSFYVHADTFSSLVASMSTVNESGCFGDDAISPIFHDFDPFWV